MLQILHTFPLLEQLTQSSRNVSFHACVVLKNFAVELQLENQAEIDIDQFKEALNRAGGANYGTGVRDL
ncbi:unnamed protein product [Euphydryas editha]|uniref:REJ domain-containing protein n=1 Tax=Euphydryas editha TaxID=104508 RepID=A0AAU9UF16_EUPED|nr:unnamed protein product [Euphydryas editha]